MRASLFCCENFLSQHVLLRARNLVLLIGSLVLSQAAFALTLIDNVRAYRAPEYTRFVFDVSGPPQYQVLPDLAPGRVVIDFRDAELKTNTDTIDLQDGPVRRVRSGAPTAGTLRVVFDLAVAVRVNSFTLTPNAQYGHRLVIDLYDQAIEQKAKTMADFVPPGSGPRKIVVAIDAGHGGEDPGARGRKGTREKDIVLAIARALRDHLQNDPGMRPVMIRDGDYYVGLKERRMTARKKHNADIFVSIHADAFTRRGARGASVFAVSRRGATSNTAAYLAEAENRADQVGGIAPTVDDDVVSVISDLIMEGTMSHSLHVGASVLKAMGSFARLHKPHVEQAGFMVLKEPNMPSILVETGFISNPEEETLLRTTAYQQRLAQAVAKGVRQYFEQYPPPGTWFAARRDGLPPATTAATPSTADTNVAQAPADTDAAAAQTADEVFAAAAAMPITVAAEPVLASSVVPKKPERSAVFAPKDKFLPHTVRRGQSLVWLANKYGVSQRAIKQANNLQRDALRIGETLKIPRH